MQGLLDQLVNEAQGGKVCLLFLIMLILRNALSITFVY